MSRLKLCSTLSLSNASLAGLLDRTTVERGVDGCESAIAATCEQIVSIERVNKVTDAKLHT